MCYSKGSLTSKDNVAESSKTSQIGLGQFLLHLMSQETEIDRVEIVALGITAHNRCCRGV